MDKPANDSNKPIASNQPTKPVVRSSVAIAAASAVLSLAALTGMAYVGWENYKLGLETTDLSEQFKVISTRAKAENAQQQLFLENMDAQLKTLAQQTSAANTGLLAQVDYMVRVAQVNVSVMHDASLALMLLKKADNLLEIGGFSASSNIRQALAHDIGALNEAAQTNLSELQLRLDNLNKEIQKLPRRELQNAQLQKTPAQLLNETTIEGTEGAWWQRMGSSIKAALSNVVILRQHQQSLPSLLSGEQQALLSGNIQLKIAQAQWAIMHGQKSLYQASLRQLADWIVRYFQVEAEASKDVLSQLQELAQINIVPALPDVSVSLQAISQALVAQPSTVAPVTPMAPTPPAAQAPKTIAPKSEKPAPRPELRPELPGSQPPAREAIPL